MNDKALSIFDEFWGSVSSPERVSIIVRNELKLTQEMASEKFGYSLKTLSDYEDQWLKDYTSANEIRRAYFAYMRDYLSGCPFEKLSAFLLKVVSDYLYLRYDLIQDCIWCKYAIRRINRMLNVE